MGWEHKNGQMRPPVNEVHLWLADYRCVTGADGIARCRALLSAEERAREAQFRRAEDQRSYLVTRVAQRLLVSRHVGIDPCDLLFVKTRFGRPYLADMQAGTPPLDFNLSHDGCLTVVALTRGCAIGVDVVSSECRPGFLQVVRRFFNACEVDALLALPAEQRPARFLDLWALKEAYIKARGEGLALALDGFAFDLERPGQIGFRLLDQARHPRRGWQFWLFHLADGVVVAVCCDPGEGPPRAVRLHAFTPFGADIALTSVPCRQSL